MKKILITGASGFVGRALCENLVSKGIAVIAVVRKESNIDDIVKLPNLSVVYTDLTEYLNLPNIISDRDIEVFYHFAWQGTSGTLRGDYNVQLQNVKSTCDAVEACNEMGIRRFVFASSIMEYEINQLMGTEEQPGINTLYSSAKLSADYMARAVAGKYGIEYIRGVISNIYGPGELSARLINTSLRKLLKGEHCSFSLGEQLYDFIYVDDAAEAFAKLGEKGHKNKTYYIGSQEPRKLKYFLLEMKDQVDPEIQIGLGEIPFSGQSLSYKEFDLKAVEQDTGFLPQVPFAEGIRKTIAWIKEGN